MNVSIIILVFITATALFYATQKLFISRKSFDEINHRSSHKTDATKNGGIVVFLTLFIFSLFFYLKGEEIYDYTLLIPLSIIFVIGVYDDFYDADYKLKFFLQIIVAKLLIDQGFVIDNFHGIFGWHEIPRLASQLFTFFVFLVIVNAVNFIDGIDGLAVSEALKVILVVELISLENTPLLSMGVILGVSLIPLYYFNFKKQNKIFLGDAGSLFLGAVIAIYLFYVLGAEYELNPQFKMNKALLTIAIVIYPLVDLLRVFIIRITQKKSPFHPDQNHLHHLLLKKGFSHFWVVIILQSASLCVLFLGLL